MKLRLFILVAFFISHYSLQAQDTTFIKSFAGGIELQVNSEGLIPGFTFYKELNPNNFLHVRVGYNIVRHGNAGLHEDERGGGFGGSVGYDRAIKFGNTSWLLGARCDGWLNKLDWRNKIGEPDEISGTTKVTVLQPTMRIGYPIKAGKDFFLPSLSFGAEVNVKTEGDEVGEGLILLLGISYIFD